MVLFFSFLLALLVIYSPVLFFDYAFHDDLSFWLKEIWAPYHYFHKTLVSMGRPLAAWVCTIDNNWVHSISDLRWLRLTAIIFFSGCAILFFKRLRQWLGNDLQAWCLALMIVTLPGAQVNVFYSIGWFFSLTVFIACLAFELGDSQKWWRQVFASIVLLAAIALNQTAAMSYWVMVFIAVIIGNKRQISFFLIGAGALLQYALLLFIIKLLSLKQSTGGFYNPNRLELNLFGKMTWFFQEPLINALNLWNIFPKIWVAIAVILFVVIALIWVVQERRSKAYYHAVFLAIALFCLSFLPNLLSSGNAPYYRCMIALSPMVLISLVWAIKQYVVLFFRRMEKVLLSSALICLLGLGSVTAFSNVLYHRALLSHKEIALFRLMAKAHRFTSNDQLLIIMPTHALSKERYDEFGIWSFHYESNYVSILKYVFKETGVEQWPVILLKFPETGKMSRCEISIYWRFPLSEYKEGQVGRDKILLLKDFNINPKDVLARHFKVELIPVESLSEKSRTFILDVRSFHLEAMRDDK